MGQLIAAHLRNELDTSQQKALQEWKMESPANEAFLTQLEQTDQVSRGMNVLYAFDLEGSKNRLTTLLAEQVSMDAGGEEEMIAVSSPVSSHKVKRLYPKLRWAVAVILLVSVGTYFFMRNQPLEDKNIRTQLTVRGTDQNGVQLTLSDGTVILVDSIQSGIMVDNQQVAIEKLAEGRIAYHSKTAKQEAVQFHTLSISKGRKYQLNLPDGTKVWLNAESSITYPSVFHAKERTVHITGEVYFEVAQNKLQPFVVDVGTRGKVEVLGTSFNISAYKEDANAKTTLVSGSVKVHYKQDIIQLLPGQSAIAGDNLQVVAKENIKQVLAWKDGYFNFTEADLTTVLRQLSRWYNITIMFDGAIPEMQFSGEISRELSLAELVKLLNASNVKCWLEGQELVIGGQ